MADTSPSLHLPHGVWVDTSLVRGSYLGVTVGVGLKAQNQSRSALEACVKATQPIDGVDGVVLIDGRGGSKNNTHSWFQLDAGNNQVWLKAIAGDAVVQIQGA